MKEAVRQTLLRVNARLSELLQESRGALRGERNFGLEEIQKLRKPIEEMAPVIAESASARSFQPEIAGQFDLYKSQLEELQNTLQQIRVMLLARQASLEAGRAQLSAVSHWVAAFRQTR